MENVLLFYLNYKKRNLECQTHFVRYFAWHSLVKKEEPVKPVEEPEAKPRPVMPTVFSSVYVNREKEEPKKTEEPVKPVKPSIDLPKIADLPKRAEEPSTTPETLSSNKEDDGIIFR